MSGYRYAFSGVLGYDLPKIRLYGSDFWRLRTAGTRYAGTCHVPSFSRTPEL